MTREEQLVFCKTCKYQKFSMNSGVICRLTDQVADFEGSCDSFHEDTDLVNRLYRTGENGTRTIASLEKRFANLILDSIFYYVFSFLIGTILAIFMVAYSPSSLSMLDSDNKITNYLVGLLVMFIYYSTSEALTGRTLGKLITRTKVVDENGLTPGINTILLRTVCRFIPFDAISFFFDDNTGWHDKLSKTKVVLV
jgi:uncharacterized RDD family membrane protein YckC